MHLVRLVPFSLIPFLLAPSARALSLDEALEQAGQNSPRIQRSRSASEEAQWRRVEAWSAFMPTLTLGATVLTDKRYVLTDINLGGANVSVPAIVPTGATSITAQYNLFDGFASTDRLQAAKALESAAAHEFDWTRFQTEREVTLQFYKTLGSKILKDVAEQNVKTLEDHLRDVNLFKKAGVSTNYDVLRVEVQVSEARSEMMNAQDNIEIAKGRLAEMLGSENPSDPTGTLPSPKADAVKNLNETSLRSRTDLLALGERVTGLAEQAEAASRHWLPRVSLFGTYQTYNNLTDHYDDWDRYRDAYQIGVNLSWNVFDGFASTARAHQATEQKYQAEKALQATTLKSRQDFQMWQRKYKYFCSVAQARANDVEKSRESVRLAKEGRRVGSRTNTDLLDAEAELYRAQAGAVNAQLGAIEALINLELATGQKLLPN